MTTTLTDRYVAAAVRRVPERQRADLERELRAAIADDIDARVGDGGSPEEAEHAALTELGDPDRLASDFAGRPSWLIGPALYFSYLRSLRLTGALSLPILLVVLLVAYRADGASVWHTIVGALGTTVTVGVYIAVLMTAIFAAVERARTNQSNKGTGQPDRIAELGRWRPEELPLPEQSNPASFWASAITDAVLAAVLIALLFVQRVISPVTNEWHQPLPIINPGLWHLWIPYFMAVTVAGVALAVAHAILRRRYLATYVLRMVLSLAAFVPLAWLFWQARVINRALGHDTGVLAAPGSWISLLVVILLALFITAQIAQIVRERKADVAA